MSGDKTTRQNRVREALGRIYDQEPPYFREYLRRFKEDPTSRVFAPLAEAYRRLGRLDEAIEICREGLQHHPDFHGGRVAIAKCFIDKKWFAEAKAELDRVVSASPENLLAQKLLGDASLALRDRDAALHCYKMALLLSPNDVALAEKVHALEKSEAEDLSGEEVVQAVMADGSETGESADSPDTFDLDAASGAEGSGRNDTLAAEKEESLWPAPARVESSYSEIAAAAEPPSEEGDSGISEGGKAEIEALLGAAEDEPDESFKIEHVSNLFSDADPASEKEITTATLGDLYYKQGQFDRALRIFEKLAERSHQPELLRKINACRMRLGVDEAALIRARQIETLRTILRKVRA